MDNIDNMQLSSTKKWFTPKTIFIVLGIAAVVEIIFGIRSLISPMPSSSSPTTTNSQTITAGKIVLVSRRSEYKVGNTVPVFIRIYTGNHQTTGSDVILHFDPKVLEATSSAALLKGKIYSEYPKLEVDPKLGLIIISGISGLNKPNFSGIGVLSTINFKAKTVGKTNLTLDFKPGSTTDSNVTDATSGKDILGSVTNLTLTIK